MIYVDVKVHYICDLWRIGQCLDLESGTITLHRLLIPVPDYCTLHCLSYTGVSLFQSN